MKNTDPIVNGVKSYFFEVARKLVVCVFLAFVFCSAVISSESKLKFELEEILSANSYLDGGSYFYLLQTTDSRNIYIFVDRSAAKKPEQWTVVAYLNSIDLTKNAEVFGNVLLAFDSRYRAAFGDQRPFEIDIGKMLESRDEEILEDLMLSILIQESCANMISFHSAELTEKIIECTFYAPEDFALRK